LSSQNIDIPGDADNDDALVGTVLSRLRSAI